MAGSVLIGAAVALRWLIGVALTAWPMRTSGFLAWP